MLAGVAGLGAPLIAARFPRAYVDANREPYELDPELFTGPLPPFANTQSVRVVGNFGLGILMDPTEGARQNDVVTYGVSFARALTNRGELVGELNGRISTRDGGAFPGTETRGLLNLGGRYTMGPVRLDAGIFFGLHTVDPTVGVTGGFTYVFNAFEVP